MPISAVISETIAVISGIVAQPAAPVRPRVRSARATSRSRTVVRPVRWASRRAPRASDATTTTPVATTTWSSGAGPAGRVTSAAPAADRR